MFSNILNTDFVDTIHIRAKQHMLDERPCYFLHLYEVIEKYIKDNSLIVSDVDQLLNTQVVVPYVTYQIYCINPYKHAVMLSNRIHTEIGKWVCMETKISHIEFSIQYNFQEVARIHSVVRHTNINSIDYIKPIKRNRLAFLPPEIEIIDVYGQLYRPNNVENWEKLVLTEKALYQMVLKRAAQKFEVSGSGQLTTPTLKKKSKPSCENCSKMDIATLRSIIVQKFIKDRYILIGHWGTNMLYGDQENFKRMTFNKLQIISQNDIEADIKALSTFLANYTNFAIKPHDYNLYIPKDFRVRRYTIRIMMPSEGGGVKQKRLMDFFNAGSYELIPYIKKTIERGQGDNLPKVYKIGTPYVLLRFIMIDILVIRMIGQAKTISQAERERLITEYINLAKMIKNGPDPVLAHPVTDYYGTDIDYGIAKRMEDRKKNNLYRRYYPEIELRNGKYRIVY